MTMATSEARTAVLSDYKVTAAFHGAERQIKAVENQPLLSRYHNWAYTLVVSAREAERTNPDSPEGAWCDCSRCLSWLARVGR